MAGEVVGAPVGVEPQELTAAECAELLASVEIGRVAWADETGRVVVVPVNFGVDDGDVIFRSAEGGKLGAVDAGRPLSFQVDDAEPAERVGWSVLVTGSASRVHDPAEVERLSAVARPWASGRSQVVRLRPEIVTGRRIPPHAGHITSVWIGPAPP